MSDLAQIEELAGTLLRLISPAERRRLLRTIARDIQKSQSARIGKQEDPSGQRFAARRPKREDRPGTYAVKFLYPKGAAEPRAVFMKNWVRQGPLMTGYDVEAGGIRSFEWDTVAKWLPVERVDQNKAAGKLRRRGTIRQRAMFRKLGSRKFLHAGSTDREAWIGFSGQAARVARVHQEGRTDRPSLNAKPVRYAKRELIGLTHRERNNMLDIVFAHVSFAN